MTAKFSVGEKVIVLGYSSGEPHEGVIISLPGKHPKGSYCFLYNHIDQHDCYDVLIYGDTYPEPETHIRKLPGDSKQDFIPPEVRKLFIPNKEKSHV